MVSLVTCYNMHFVDRLTQAFLYTVDRSCRAEILYITHLCSLDVVLALLSSSDTITFVVEIARVPTTKAHRRVTFRPPGSLAPLLPPRDGKVNNTFNLYAHSFSFAQPSVHAEIFREGPTLSLTVNIMSAAYQTAREC